MVEHRAAKFLQGLEPKQYKQVAARIFLLSQNPRPHDSAQLEGHPGLRRLDQGEFRVVYAVMDSERLVIVRRTGKRNDDEVYRGLESHAVKKFDNDLLRRIVMGAIRNHNDCHPDLAVRPEAFTSIAKRAARTVPPLARPIQVAL